MALQCKKNHVARPLDAQEHQIKKIFGRFFETNDFHLVAEDAAGDNFTIICNS